MLSMVMKLLKQEVGGRELNSHGITLLIGQNHGKLWNCDFEFLWDPTVVPLGYSLFSF